MDTHTNGVVIDNALGFGLCGGHDGGFDGEGAEKSAEERRGGR